MENLGSLIQTQTQRVLVIDVIDALVDNIYQLKDDAQQILSTLPPALATILGSVINGDFVSLSPEDKEKFLLDIKKDLDKCQVVNVTMAFRPNNTFLDQLVSWVKKEVGQAAIVDISVDGSLVGGAVINFKGYYHDMTLKRELDEYFSSKFL